MAKQNDGLSNLQYVSLIASSIIGVVVISIPRIAVESSGKEAFISMSICAILAMFFAVTISILGKRFPKKTVIEYLPLIIGKVPGKIIGGFISLYFILITITALRGFSDALKGVLLENTPLEIIIITMLLVVCYLILNGIGAIAKISELFMPIIILSLFIVIGFSLKNFSPIKIMPMLTLPSFTSLKGVPGLMMAFTGYEIILFCIPFMNSHDHVTRYGILGAAIPSLLYALLIFAVIGVFGVSTTKQLTFPTITLARSIAFPGAFIERFDVFFVVLWILAVFTTLANFYYMAVLSIVRLVGLRNYKPIIFILLPLMYIIGIIPQNIFQIQGLTTFAGYLGLAVSIVPVILLLLAWLRGKKEIKDA